MKKSEKNISILCKRLELVNQISVSDASELLNLSDSSIRRIFLKMAKQNLAIRTHGGLARKTTKDTSPVSYDYRIVQSINLPQKKRIASKVAQLISDKNSIYLDSGSTLYRISLALSSLLCNNYQPELKVLTNSLKNLEVLTDSCSIKLTGGDYRKSRHDLFGFIAEQSISMINFDVCVIGADGISIENGLTTTDFDTASLCIKAIKNSKLKILAADSSKFEKVSLVTYAKITDFDILVTDDGISNDYIASLEKTGIKVFVV